MSKLTKAQQEALKAVFNRTPIDAWHNRLEPLKGMPISYLQFRRAVVIGWGCIMVKWCGMWLGIEPDGYTHS